MCPCVFVCVRVRVSFFLPSLSRSFGLFSSTCFFLLFFFYFTLACCTLYLFLFGFLVFFCFVFSDSKTSRHAAAIELNQLKGFQFSVDSFASVFYFLLFSAFLVTESTCESCFCFVLVRFLFQQFCHFLFLFSIYVRLFTSFSFSVSAHLIRYPVCTYVYYVYIYIYIQLPIAWEALP